MAKQHVCDLCRKPTAQIAAKMWYTKIKPEMRRRGFSIHGAYSHYLDVGECCADRVLELFNWTERKPKKSSKQK